MCGQTNEQQRKMDFIAMRNCVDRMQTQYINGEISACADKQCKKTTNGAQLFCLRLKVLFGREKFLGLPILCFFFFACCALNIRILELSRAGMIFRWLIIDRCP